MSRFRDFAILEKIDYTTRNILVLSYIYYNMNYNVVSDIVYDKRLKYLCKIVNENQEIINQSSYYDVIKDIDPSTGFDLFYKLSDKDQEYLKQIALNVVKQHQLA